MTKKEVSKNIIRISLLAIALMSTVYFLYKNDKTFGDSDKFKNISGVYDIINLGNSHGNSFNYDALGINGKSFNRSANSPYYDLQNFKYVKPFLKKNAVVVIPVSFFSFGMDENRSDTGNDAFVNEFYQYLPNDAIFNFSYTKKINLLMNKVKRGFFQLFTVSKKLEAQPSLNLNTPQKLIRHAKGRAKRHMVIGEANDPGKNIEYYSSLISEIRQSGHYAVLVTTPYYEGYNSNFDQAWLRENFYNPLDTLLLTFSVPYLNYASDIEFSGNAKLFSDSDHLNNIGKIKFSERFFKDLDSLGLLVKIRAD